MGHLFWLSDEAWATIEPHLPKNQPGARRVDDRRVIGGILHIVKSGCRWRDCPAVYGPRTTIYNSFNRWSRRRELIDKLRGQDLDIGTPRKGDDRGANEGSFEAALQPLLIHARPDQVISASVTDRLRHVAPKGTPRGRWSALSREAQIAYYSAPPVSRCLKDW